MPAGYLAYSLKARYKLKNENTAYSQNGTENIFDTIKNELYLDRENSILEENGAQNFLEERERLNRIVMKYAGVNSKRFHNIDWQVYQEGVLPMKVKELMGLVSSLVLRCDDCIMYHLIRCREEGVTDSELEETVAIGLIVGGSITIPHIRRIWDTWDKMK